MHRLARHIHARGWAFAAITGGLPSDAKDLHKSVADLSRAAPHYYRKHADFSRSAPTFANQAADFCRSGEMNGSLARTWPFINLDNHSANDD